MSSTRKRTFLSFEDKNRLVQFLLANCNKFPCPNVLGVPAAPFDAHVPARGKITEAATMFNVGRQTVTYIWAAAKRQLDEGKPINMSSNKLGKARTKKVTLDIEKLKATPWEERNSIRAVAEVLEVSKTTVARWVKDKEIKPHSNAMKPYLTDEGKLLRLEFSLSLLHYDRQLNVIRFGSMENIIHIDEKWFYITRQTEHYYKTPDETAPHRTCTNKRFLTKVMFECAVGRPHYAADGTCIWDGKIGMFAFTKLEPAKRNSKNRQRGTMEVKPIESVTRDVIRDCLVNQVSVLTLCCK